MTSVPLGTLIGRSSIVRVTRSSAITLPASRSPHPGCSCHQRPAPAGDVVLELIPELLDPRDHRCRARVREHADRLAGHVLRQIEQQVEVLRLALARENALEDLRGPGGALATLRTLGARLVRVEARQPHDLVDHVRRVVEYDDAARAQQGALLGSGGVIVFDDSTDMVYQIMRLARFYAHESCAQCTQCREGTAWTTKIMERILAGQGKPTDLDLLLDLSENMTGKTICVLSDSCAAPIVSGIKKFRSEFEDDLTGRRKPVMVA